MKANEKKYSIICTTDTYNAARHIGFSKRAKVKAQEEE